MSEILCSAIPSFLTLVGVIITSIVTSRTTRDNVTHKLEISQAVTDTKIEELTREVRKHNGFAEKIPVINEQIKLINHRLRDIEEDE